MSFGLENAGSTYQRLVNKMFKNQLGDTMEVYIDEMLVKSKKVADHVNHLEETFSILLKYKMKLNPSKCSFGVAAGKFMGYIVTQRGIEASPDHVRAVIDIQSPRNLKEVQKLTGRVAALNRYSSLEKLALALIVASRKLRHYFETHPIVVKTNYLVKAVLRRPELTGRMSKWAIELSGFGITYEPRTAIKSQALADFLADFSPDLEQQAALESEQINQVHNPSTWILNVDGSSNFRGAGLGVVLESPQEDMMVQAIYCDFKATNNEAEYEALIAGMNLVKGLGITNLQVLCDSLFVASQMNGEFTAKDSKMVLYLDFAKSLATKFSTFTIKEIPRDKNTQADALANLGSTLRKSKFSSIPLIHLLAHVVDTANLPPKPSIPEPVKPDPDNPEIPTPTPSQPVKIEPEEPNFVAPVTNPTSWMQPIFDYLEHGTLPENKAEARALRFKASRYTIIQGALFKNSTRGILQRCIKEDGYEQILKDFHDGECGAHSAGRTLANRILTYGYYWPTLRVDAHRYVRKCDSCQKHSGFTHKPSMPLHPTLTPWPFMIWGMDIVGKLPAAPGQKVYMLTLTDYFSKWIEAYAF
ncbi:uncharacterized protein LOC110729291 [Chenopodium quinoa]|uniref:uncharacterized protein LOC110729291 n=1 Tax=Chenopodium quinoa TaxID=63459 RepID=UPI000B78BC0C|nr:uncharacterized protein LOC110729291 [Chenopodium quinoa]